ncbi:hypothetical protein WH47_00631 [Habropoda laboriosa]|uniref:Uncharacterized protein n=1 Tax=Habropoda laboriosa TaxID=597456 RepID=A0A0L7RID4_9HYME|nr:hypothetical protein WH47_00631 [Habropoda laboriosa]
MHFSWSSEVLYFHSASVSVHTNSHADLERHVVASWVVYTEYKATRHKEREREREREREGEGGKRRKRRIVPGVSLVGMLGAARSPKAKLSFFRNCE